MMLRGVWASRSTDGGVTWSAPGRVHDGPARYNLTAGISDTGVIRAGWEEADYLNSETVVWSGLFNPPTNNWLAAAVAPATNVIHEHYTRLAMDGSGAGVLVFIDETSAAMDTTRLWAVAFSGSMPMPSPKMLAMTPDSLNFYRPVVTVAPGGQRLAVLVVEDMTTSETLWMHELDKGTWNAPLKVTNAYGVYAPAAVMDGNGVTTAAWMQSLANGNYGVLAARRDSTGAFGAAMPIETTTIASNAASDDGPAPHLGVDGMGRVFGTWNRKIMATGTFPAVVRRFADGAWGPETLFEIKKDLGYANPAIAVAPNGNAAIATVVENPRQITDPSVYNVFVALFH
jgi:hypothetical protein